MMHAPATTAEWARGAMLFSGLGDFHRAVTTSSAEAQRYFDQGMVFMWGFNHDEATRSFAKAAEIDPDCAACYWGVALTVGPNYNLPFMVAERAAVATEALDMARVHQGNASPKEQALITALVERYPGNAPLDPVALQPVLLAYADAMYKVATDFPDDLDIQTLYAESLMNLRAWKLWQPDGTPAPGTLQIVAVLESVMRRDPKHPGANHYYVHAIEGSSHPEKATASAELLRNLIPAAGHLVHMPAHIFQRVGRYEDAAEANRLAAIADQKYTGLTTPPDYYGMYSAHNYQFLAYSAAMEGRKAETLEATDRSREVLSDEMLLQMPGADWYVAEYYAARVRFGLWNQLLEMHEPDPRLPGLLGGYLYGRAMAQAATGRVTEARLTLASLNTLVAKLPADAAAGQNSLKAVLAIAVPMIDARIAASEHRSHDEIRSLRQAIAAEDMLGYDEPRNWFVPSRQVLGQALLRSGNAQEAEAVYREDLRQNPDNGWALCGLRDALAAQGKRAAAKSAAADFEKSWARSDIKLSASAL
jgi:tetratricopeptide (TPR) repeat protein